MQNLLFSCPCCSMKTLKWLIHEGAACTRWELWSVITNWNWATLNYICCNLLPNDLHIPYVYVPLLFYFYWLNGILHLLPLKTSLGSDPFSISISSILSDFFLSHCSATWLLFQFSGSTLYRFLNILIFDFFVVVKVILSASGTYAY